MAAASASTTGNISFRSLARSACTHQIRSQRGVKARDRCNFNSKLDIKEQCTAELAIQFCMIITVYNNNTAWPYASVANQRQEQISEVIAVPCNAPKCNKEGLVKVFLHSFRTAAFLFLAKGQKLTSIITPKKRFEKPNMSRKQLFSKVQRLDKSVMHII